MDQRVDWHDYFLGFASQAATRSDCRRAQVGAVLVDIDERRILGTGYPGTARGRPGCLDGACPRGHLSHQQCPPGASYDNCISVHAEINALLGVPRRELARADMYITREPCRHCCAVMQVAGLRYAIWPHPRHKHAVRPLRSWLDEPTDG